MGFLRDSDIYAKLEDIFPEDYADFIRNGSLSSRLQPSSFELTLGKEVYLSGDAELVRLGDEDEKQTYVKIRPGDFAILLTKEKIVLPRNMMALISIKSAFKEKGLVNISGFHVDPGFKGSLHFSVYNAGPTDIILRFDEPIFVIFFIQFEGGNVDNPYNGKHQNQGKIPSKSMNSLVGGSVSPYDLNDRLTKLELTNKFQWGLLIALFGGVMSAIFSILTNKPK
jgi:dCTP deaminase